MNVLVDRGAENSMLCISHLRRRCDPVVMHKSNHNLRKYVMTVFYTIITHLPVPDEPLTTL